MFHARKCVEGWFTKKYLMWNDKYRIEVFTYIVSSKLLSIGEPIEYACVYTGYCLETRTCAVKKFVEPTRVRYKVSLCSGDLYSIIVAGVENIHTSHVHRRRRRIANDIIDNFTARVRNLKIIMAPEIRNGRERVPVCFASR